MRVLKLLIVAGFSILSYEAAYSTNHSKFYEDKETSRLNEIIKIYVDDKLDRQRRYDLEVLEDQKVKKDAPAETSGPRMNPKVEVPKPPKGWHLPAIGQVRVPRNNNYYDAGTATHIGEGWLVSAAHVFYAIIKENFPERPIEKKVGRVKIDLSKRGAFFVSEGIDCKTIKLTAIVFDVRYINTMDRHKDKSFGESTERFDYTFVLMDTNQMPAGMPAIPLIESDNVFSLKGLKAPKMCAYYGYGAAADETVKGRHHVVQQLVLNPYLKAWDAFYLNARDTVKHGHTMYAAADLETILNKKGLEKRFDRESSIAQPGDSGGGLILKTKQGLRLIAVCATYCYEYDDWGIRCEKNGFASFVQGSLKDGYSGNKELLEMVSKLKKKSKQ